MRHDFFNPIPHREAGEIFRQRPTYWFGSDQRERQVRDKVKIAIPRDSCDFFNSTSTNACRLSLSLPAGIRAPFTSGRSSPSTFIGSLLPRARQSIIVSILVSILISPSQKTKIKTKIETNIQIAKIGTRCTTRSWKLRPHPFRSRKLRAPLSFAVLVNRW